MTPLLLLSNSRKIIGRITLFYTWFVSLIVYVSIGRLNIFHLFSLSQLQSYKTIKGPHFISIRIYIFMGSYPSSNCKIFASRSIKEFGRATLKYNFSCPKCCFNTKKKKPCLHQITSDIKWIHSDNPLFLGTRSVTYFVRVRRSQGTCTEHNSF